MTDTLQPWKIKIMDPPSNDEALKIAQFLQSQLSGYHFSERNLIIAWKLVDNKVHTGFATVMVINSPDKILSVCTITPKRLWRNGAEHLWGEIGDTFTDKALLRKAILALRKSSPPRSLDNDSRAVEKRKGLFEELVDATRTRAQSKGISIIYGMPNDQSLSGYINKLNFKVKEDIIVDQYVCVLSTASLSNQAIVKNKPWLNALLQNKIIVNNSRMITSFILSSVMPRHRDIAIEEVKSFNDEFNDLWRRARVSLPNAQVRDSTYLNWRYNASPFEFHVLGARKNGKLIGYVSTLTLHHKGEGEFVHTIFLDWLFDSQDSDVNKALIAGAVKYSISKKADVISAMVTRSSPCKLSFGRMGFLRRATNRPLIVHVNPEGKKLLGDTSPWHFTLSDTDSF